MSKKTTPKHATFRQGWCTPFKVKQKVPKYLPQPKEVLEVVKDKNDEIVVITSSPSTDISSSVEDDSVRNLPIQEVVTASSGVGRRCSQGGVSQGGISELTDGEIECWEKANPTSSPTDSPTSYPTDSLTSSPTTNPTSSPTTNPTSSPTDSPTSSPTTNPPTSWDWEKGGGNGGEGTQKNTPLSSPSPSSHASLFHDVADLQSTTTTEGTTATPPKTPAFNIIQRPSLSPPPCAKLSNRVVPLLELEETIRFTSPSTCVSDLSNVSR